MKRVMNSLCGASILRPSRGVVNRSDHRVLHAIERIFCEGEVKMLWSGIISQLSLSDFMTEPKLKFRSPVTLRNHVFTIFLFVDAVPVVILTLKY